MLDGKTIAIIGYGSQGPRTTPSTLRIQGCNVIIGLYEGSKSWAKAEAQGFKVYTSAEAAKQADIIMILINDEKQAELYKTTLLLTLKPAICLCSLMALTFTLSRLFPLLTLTLQMVAPKGPGHTVRSEYQAGKGVPCLVAVHQDATGKAKDLALAYALGIGGARAGVP